MSKTRKIRNLPKVSIIILNHNGKHFLNRCLASLKEIDYPPNLHEVILVDNSSSDDSVDFVKKHFPWVKVISLDRNYGFGGGNNRGIRRATGNYFAFLNNDTKVMRRWLTELVTASIENSTPVCASKTLFMNDPSIVDYGGGKLTISGRGYSTAFGKRNVENVESPTYTGYPCAAAMLIRKDVFLKVGQFDEDYFACLDDTDLGWRTWLLGYTILYCPKSVVHHVGGGTTGRKRISHTKAFHGPKNSLMNILKNLEFRNILFGVILAFIYDFIEVISLMRVKDASCIKKRIKAYIWVIRNLRRILQKRYTVQQSRAVSDKWLYANKLMVSFKDALREHIRLGRLNLRFWKT
ncbi:MAG: glycosyltransferase family 2 protein [Promethearchaeota archaeon]